MDSQIRFSIYALIIFCLYVSNGTSLGVDNHFQESDIMVTISSATSIARTDDNFICATLDWWPPNKCSSDGQCPWGRAGIHHMDLKNKILYNAIKEFNPLRLRVGGSLQDQVFYDVGKVQVDCHLTFHSMPGQNFGFTSGCLHMQRWDELAHFFNESGAKITFGLNALFGRIKLKDDDLYVGDWNPQNALDFMKYNILKGYTIDSYELGNELTGGISARVEAQQYAKDMKTLKLVVEELYPNPQTRPKILGPGGFYDKKWFTIFLQESGPNVIDGVTHHIYNLGEGISKEVINKVQDPYYLTKVARNIKDLSRTIDLFAPWSEAWVGESGGAFNSGSKDVSHAFASGFWYLDQMGIASIFNHKVFCRQTLIGGNYGMLNTTSFIPNPDYYGALLWHRLMGSNVLATTHNGSPYLRAYSHCSKTKPGISVLLINMSNSTTFHVSLANNLNFFPGPMMTIEDIESQQREEYHLTPKDANILSDVVLLNGKELKLNESFYIPELKPKVVNSTSPIKVVPDSFVFIVVRNFRAPACV